MADFLEKFYAVTKTSVYEVVAKDKDGNPYAIKIALHGKSKFGIGEKLNGGTMLAIAKSLQFFIPESHSMASPQTGFERRLEHVNTMWWRGGSSDIVALFLKKEEALSCSKESNLTKCDPRWLNQTREVLEKIGEEHPTISICHDPTLCLIKE